MDDREDDDDPLQRLVDTLESQIAGVVTRISFQHLMNADEAG